MAATILPRDTSAFRTCEDCGNEQGDLGADVACENCGDGNWTSPYYYASSKSANRTYLTEGYMEENSVDAPCEAVPGKKPVSKIISNELHARFLSAVARMSKANAAGNIKDFIPAADEAIRLLQKLNHLENGGPDPDDATNVAEDPISQMMDHLTRAAMIAKEKAIDYKLVGKRLDGSVQYLVAICFDEHKAERANAILEEGH